MDLLQANQAGKRTTTVRVTPGGLRKVDSPPGAPCAQKWHESPLLDAPIVDKTR